MLAGGFPEANRLVETAGGQELAARGVGKTGDGPALAGRPRFALARLGIPHDNNWRGMPAAIQGRDGLAILRDPENLEVLVGHYAFEVTNLVPLGGVP